MTIEELQAARAAHWRQDNRPILTLEDARAFFAIHPLSLYRPLQAQLPAAAPSFAEACEGKPASALSGAGVERASDLLARLIASGEVVALNLLGSSGETPDFLAHSRVLPYVFALRGEREWKQAPQSSGSRRVSPLSVECWNALDREGPLTVAAARESLGREISEAAVMRSLGELWQRMRAVPVIGGSGQRAVWELLRLRHRDSLLTGEGTSQVTALSLLASAYLESAYAAPMEEIETFLSPLASRSRIREAVRGLAATQQVHSLSMGSGTFYFIAGSLPETSRPTAPEQALGPRERRGPKFGEPAAAPRPSRHESPGMPPMPGKPVPGRPIFAREFRPAARAASASPSGGREMRPRESWLNRPARASAPPVVPSPSGRSQGRPDKWRREERPSPNRANARANGRGNDRTGHRNPGPHKRPQGRPQGPPEPRPDRADERRSERRPERRNQGGYAKAARPGAERSGKTNDPARPVSRDQRPQERWQRFPKNPQPQQRTGQPQEGNLSGKRSFAPAGRPKDSVAGRGAGGASFRPRAEGKRAPGNFPRDARFSPRKFAGKSGGKFSGKFKQDKPGRPGRFSGSDSAGPGNPRPVRAGQIKRGAPRNESSAPGSFNTPRPSGARPSSRPSSRTGPRPGLQPGSDFGRKRFGPPGGEDRSSKAQRPAARPAPGGFAKAGAPARVPRNNPKFGGDSAGTLKPWKYPKRAPQRPAKRNFSKKRPEA